MKKPAQDAKTAADPTERQTRADPTDPAERQTRADPARTPFFLGIFNYSVTLNNVDIKFAA